MKKLIFYIFLNFLMFILEVNATTISIDGPEKISKNEEFEISINVNNITNLIAMDFDYDYPVEKLKLDTENYDKDNDWSVVLGKRLALATSGDGFTGSKNIIKLKFTALDTFETAKISIKNITAVDVNSKLIPIEDVSYTLSSTLEEQKAIKSSISYFIILSLFGITCLFIYFLNNILKR